MKILVINPGSTSTKISLFNDRKEVFTESIFHDAPLLLSYKSVNDQVPFRKALILDVLSKHGYNIKEIDITVGRGGSAYPQEEGVIKIDERLYNDTLNAVGKSEHAAKLGVLISYDLEKEFNIPSYTLNATNVDELCDYARITGIAGLYRNAQSHVLNQKATARLHADKIGKKYEDCNFIVCHIDGGITVNAHKKGRMVDGNVGSGGDGPFSPTRIGSVPVLSIVDYLKDHTAHDLEVLCARSGGFVSHFGTSNSNTIHALVEQGDEKASLIWNAMIYQICKNIGAMSTVLEGKTDAIILTGGLVRFNDIVNSIKQKCSWIAPVAVYPGEMEQQTMAHTVLNALNGKEKVNKYTGKPVWNGFKWEQQEK